MQDRGACSEATDEGYLFSDPVIERRTKKLKDGTVLVAYHQHGIVVSQTPGSPWHHATCLAQGTTVKDPAGAVVLDVALCEMTDVDGDLTWSTWWRPGGGAGRLSLEVGTGKWEGITGDGTLREDLCARADGYAMPQWDISWGLDPARHAGEADIDEGSYTHHDTGLSFHGPHITELTRELKNGMNLAVSNQSGVLISEQPDAKSPRHYATNFDRGTTIKQGEKTLGDVMLLEDTDPDGDTVWLCHVWWYGKGPGSYRFLGGTGKWEGIVGEGRTLGMLRERNDDHYMLRSEMFWRMT